MNWVFTRAETPVWFARDEPICHIFPIRRSDIEAVDPEIRRLVQCAPNCRPNMSFGSTPGELSTTISRGRDQTRRDGKSCISAALRPGSDHELTKDHRTRVRLRSFVDKTTKAG